MKKYQVIAAFDGWHWFGESDNLTSAKRIATNNSIYNTDMLGFDKPAIYRSEDVIDGPCGRVPAPSAKPVVRWMAFMERWVDW